MKNFMCLCFMLIAVAIANAQNLCDGHEKPIGGVTKELLRGRLKKDGQLYGNPYTLMDRVKYNDPNDGFIAIRKVLKDPKNIALRKLYLDSILTFANKPLSELMAIAENDEFEHAKSTKPSPLAKWAKFNAFVFVIGLDASFNKMDAASSQRIQYRQNAMDAFKNMNCRVYGKDFAHILHYWFVPGVGC